jgi:hypothetical protein
MTSRCRGDVGKSRPPRLRWRCGNACSMPIVAAKRQTKRLAKPAAKPPGSTLTGSHHLGGRAALGAADSRDPTFTLPPLVSGAADPRSGGCRRCRRRDSGAGSGASRDEPREASERSRAGSHAPLWRRPARSSLRRGGRERAAERGDRQARDRRRGPQRCRGDPAGLARGASHSIRMRAVVTARAAQPTASSRRAATCCQPSFQRRGAEPNRPSRPGGSIPRSRQKPHRRGRRSPVPPADRAAARARPAVAQPPSAPLPPGPTAGGSA